MTAYSEICAQTSSERTIRSRVEASNVAVDDPSRHLNGGMMKKSVVGASIVVAALATVGLVTPPASAVSHNGSCEASAFTLDSNGEFCLYYSPDLTNSLWDRSFGAGGDNDLANDWFVSGGAGQGQVVRNNAASANNRFRGESVYVYRYVNYAGTSVFVGSNSWTNLGVLRNDEASYRWVE